MALSKSSTVSAALEQQASHSTHKRRISSPSRHEEFPAVIKKRRHSASLPHHREGGQAHSGMAPHTRKRPVATNSLQDSCPCPAKRSKISFPSPRRFSGHINKLTRRVDQAEDAANVTTSGRKRQRSAAARVATEPSPCSAKRQRTQSGAAATASPAQSPGTGHSQLAPGEAGSPSLPFVTAATHHTPPRPKAPQQACFNNKNRPNMRLFPWWRHTKQRKLLKEEKEALRFLHQIDIALLTIADVEQIVSNGTKRLGSGAYGSCDKAVDPTTQQPLVIKTFAKDLNGLDDLISEATNLRHLQLPGVQRLVGVCVHTRQMISHFAGITAKRYFKRNAPSLADTLSVFGQVSRTLQHVLDKGLTHNDLKSDNVCVQADTDVPEATIIDFGLARRVGTLLIYEKCSDSKRLPWLAPELLRHTYPCGEASDVFSLAHLIKESLPVRSRSEQRPSLAALKELVRRAQLITPAKRPRLSAFTELLQQMHEEATKSAKE
ncbi:Tyrosine-protein kinase SYK [Portunus trituberculatus]|uniref:Tyrosine-protein kinase SYK n=1 Tax=Portunus trituberculatus TaxID=210409 RepID=A0A5B7HJE6_PORTR|nr:Tyrosine-protein kinase SYK [Portunus trituberculatus]